MIRYKTIMNEACAEQEIERSRFIAYVSPVSTKEEADAFITKIKEKHRDATHNVPAMVIGEKMQIQWASDDGEPQGTSGAPIVQMLVKEGFTNIAVVVTRYFGGIKLGTGGLVRAYTSSAKLGMIAGLPCVVKEMQALSFKMDYTFLAKLQNMAAQTQVVLTDESQETSSNSNAGLPKFTIGDIVYEDVVTLTLLTEPESAESLKGLVANLTGGSALLISEELRLEKVGIDQ